MHYLLLANLFLPNLSFPLILVAVSISPADSSICEKDWLDFENNLLSWLIDDNAISVQYYTIPPEAGISPTPILPSLPSVEIISPTSSTLAEPCHLTISTISIGDLATLPSTVAPQPTTLYVPTHCTNCSAQCGCAIYGGSNNVSYRKCPAYKSES